MFSQLVEKTRTIRRFDVSKIVTDADLEDILSCAGRVASAGNLQRLRYVTVSGKGALDAFSMVSLGGLLPEEKKPTIAVAPVSYVVLTSAEENPDPNLLIDVGIAAEAISLAAAEKGIGACMIRNFNKDYFASLMTEKYKHPILVIALGYPKEVAKIAQVSDGESLKYYKNESEENIVPKIKLSDLIIKKYD